MFDLGRTLLAVVERSPDTLAIVDGERRLSYAAWYCEIGRVAGGLAALGLSRRDRLAVILQNRLEMATLHWACQFARETKKISTACLSGRLLSPLLRQSHDACALLTPCRRTESGRPDPTN